MPEPIDRLEAIQRIKNDFCSECDCEYGDASCKVCEYDFCIGILNEMPTIEPEVRHGRMIEGRYPNENKCSECGKMFRDDIGFIIQDEYGAFHNPVRCPECGCYWDGGADNDKT